MLTGPKLILTFLAGALLTAWLLWSPVVSADPCAPSGIQPYDLPSRHNPIPYSEVTPFAVPSDAYHGQIGSSYPQGKPTY